MNIIKNKMNYGVVPCNIPVDQSSAERGYRTRHLPYSFSFNNPLFKNASLETISSQMEKIEKKKRKLDKLKQKEFIPPINTLNKTLKHESRGKFLDEIRKREDARVSKENNCVIAIYNRSMHFVGKINKEFKELICQIYKFGFGIDKNRVNYLKSQQYTSHVHSMFINNGIVEDEDQMPFMDGYLLTNNESDDDSDTSIDKDKNYSRSLSNKSENGEAMDKAEIACKESIDNNLRNYFKIQSINDDAEFKEKINSLFSLIPEDKRYTNNIYLRILYKMLCFF